MQSGLPARVEQYLSEKLGFKEARVTSAKQILEGISRETWRIDMSLQKQPERCVILRLDPVASLLPSGRKNEAAVYKALTNNVHEIPVPGLVCDEDDPAWLGAPFIIAELLPGTANPALLLTPPYAEHAAAIARQSFEILGRISAVPYRALGLEKAFEDVSPESCWNVALGHWERVLRDNSIGALPVTSAAIRQLKRCPPPPAQRVALVHGDYRLGNYLFLPEGISGILDWEMSHLGDPLEDLAWALLKFWRFGAVPDKIAGFLSPQEAVSIWEKSSGLKVDFEALKWWTILAHIKAMALWVTSGHIFSTGQTTVLSYAIISWASVPAQEMALLEDMGMI